MRRTLIGIVFVSVLFAFIFAVASAQATVGVQAGDWIEYNVSSTGAPNQGHDVEWARMEVTQVQAPNVTIQITSNYTDGTSETTTSTLNIETGHLIDDFIIPAGLNVGDSFPDENYGNVTITGSEVLTVAGAARTVLTATLGNNSYVWDQETGVSVEGNTTTSDYAIYSVASSTNMWTAAPTQVQDTTASVIMTVVGVLIIVGLIVVGSLVRRYRKPVDIPRHAGPGPC